MPSTGSPPPKAHRGARGLQDQPGKAACVHSALRPLGCAALARALTREAALRGYTRNRSQYWEKPICCSHIWTSASFQLGTQGRMGLGTSSSSRRSARLASVDVVPFVE